MDIKDLDFEWLIKEINERENRNHFDIYYGTDDILHNNGFEDLRTTDSLAKIMSIISELDQNIKKALNTWP